ncbi:MAG TPA: hypothetical protein VGQ41_11285 [Pyrinomonadaceae bacterium]|jgi:hypothetical protein|nr:hypothetical protein [Pyrinomonadaceae bacterium]
MRRVILWLAAILITFAIGVGADQLWWWLFKAVPPVPSNVQPLAVDCGPPIRDIVYIPAPPTPPEKNFILDVDHERFNIGALFYIIGPKSKAFADLDSFEVWLNPQSTTHLGSIFVSTGKGDEYDSAAANFALVTERRVFFATEKLKKADFEYRFDGEWLRTDFDAVDGKKKAVLRGTLTKTKNGLTIAQEEFTFRMESMGC